MIPGVSVVVLTLNEALNIEPCLRTVAWSDDVWVVDSMSSDGTQARAAAAGAQVIERAFDDWATHQNWVLANVHFRYDWVLYIDADERVTPVLRAEIESAVAAPGANVGFEVTRIDHFFGNRIGRCQATRHYIRLFRPASVRYERLVNPVTIVDGPVGRVRGELLHFPMSKGLSEWIAKHNRYSDLEAKELIEARSGPLRLTYRGGRATAKQLFYRAPGRPALRFIWLYFARAGFLDGRAGLRYSLLQAGYEYVIGLKAAELRTAEAARK